MRLYLQVVPLFTPIIIIIIFFLKIGDFVSTMEVKGKEVLCVEPEALTMIAEQAMVDIAHLLRPAHLQVCLFI